MRVSNILKINVIINKHRNYDSVKFNFQMAYNLWTCIVLNSNSYNNNKHVFT